MRLLEELALLAVFALVVLPLYSMCWLGLHPFTNQALEKRWCAVCGRTKQ